MACYMALFLAVMAVSRVSTQSEESQSFPSETWSTTSQTFDGGESTTTASDFNTWSPYQTTNSGVCDDDAVLQDMCTVPEDMSDVTFWDLYSVLFSETVLDALVMGCNKGTWCLQDKFDYWEALIVERAEMIMNSEVADGMCLPDVQQCIEITPTNYANCTVFSEMQFTSSAIGLICELRDNPDVTVECYKHVLTALHVTLADIMREQYNQGTDIFSDETCQSPEAHMTKGLICMFNSCPGESEVFTQFNPWSWFTSVVDDMIASCDLDPNTCESLIQVGASSATLTSSSRRESSRTSVSYLKTTQMTSTSDDVETSSYVEYVTSQDSSLKNPMAIYESDVVTLVCVSVATMVTAILLLILVCIFYRRHRRNAVIKDGYQKLLNDGDES